MAIRSISVCAAALTLSQAFAGCSNPSTDKRSDAAQVTDAGVVPACGSDEKPTCPTPKPSYKADVAPILESQCNNCHVGGPTEPWPLSRIEDLVHWRGPLLSSVVDCTMPPVDAGKPFSAEDRATIIGWIACGMADD